jgi:hypothetical protein
VPGCSVDTDASDTFAGDFVKYVIRIRLSGPVGVTPFKFEAHLGLPRGYCPPQPLPSIHFLYAARQSVAISCCAPFRVTPPAQTMIESRRSSVAFWWALHAPALGCSAKLRRSRGGLPTV